MSDNLHYQGAITIPLYGASSGYLDLSPSDWSPRAFIAQADLRTNSSYKVGILLGKAIPSATTYIDGGAITGGGFTNQPGGAVVYAKGVTGDAGKTVTVYGTVAGSDKVTTDTITIGATATTPVAGTVSFDEVMAVELSAVSAGTITVELASTADVATVATPATTAGVTAVSSANQYLLHGLTFGAVASDTSTAKVGAVGEDKLGNTIYDAQALVDASTTIYSNKGFARITKLFTGGLAGTRTIRFSVGGLTFSSASQTLTDLGTTSGPSGSLIPVSARYLHWCLYNGTTATAGGANDYILVELYG